MKKFVLPLLLSLVLLPIASQPVLAIKEFDEFQAGVVNTLETNQPNLGSYTNDAVGNKLSAWFGHMVGGIPEEVALNPDGTTQYVYSEGLMSNVGHLIAYMYDSPPATTERYVADVLNSAGIKLAQPAYAQGLGFASLQPVLETWKTFRNVAYLFFVVIFLVIGFLIMLRQQVGQTAVTAQQAIPQIIVALLVVTFSYAIAGLLIDFMYLVMYLLLALFGKVTTAAQADFLDHNLFDLGWRMIVTGFGTAKEAVTTFISSIFSGDFWNWLEEGLGIMAAVLVAAAIVFKIFELFLELLKTYVSIILSVVFSPVLLMFGAIPGKNPFKQWLMDLVGNLAAFPIVLLVLIMFDQLTGGISGADVAMQDGGFMPPFLLNTGAGFGGVMGFMVGVGMLMIMPELVRKGKEALGAKEGAFSQFAQNIGDSLKKGWTGGELVPGMAFTDTNKIFEKRLGGISVQSAAQKLWRGSEQTRQAADDHKLTFLGRGLVPGIVHIVRDRQEIKADKESAQPQQEKQPATHDRPSDDHQAAQPVDSFR